MRTMDGVTDEVTAVTVDMADAMMTDHAVVATMTNDAVMAVAAAVTATMRTRIGSGGDESCQADDKRRGEGKECSTFEHSQRPFGSM